MHYYGGKSKREELISIDLFFMPHFCNQMDSIFTESILFDLQSINSHISFLKYNVISNYA